MSKLKIKLRLKNSNEDLSKEIIGLKRGNKIHFLDDKVKVTLTLDEIVSLRRVSNEYEIVLNFKEPSEKYSFPFPFLSPSKYSPSNKIWLLS